MRELKVGDKVKIRTWEDMKKEFQFTEHGSIQAGTGSFTKRMAKWGEQFVTVSYMLTPQLGYTRFQIEEDETCYIWDETMIEPAEPKRIYFLEYSYDNFRTIKIYSTRDLAMNAIHQLVEGSENETEWSFTIRSRPIDQFESCLTHF